MLNNQLELFTDRHKAIALFEHIRARDPEKPWPLLPMLAFIASPGSGKSALIEYLRVKKCCLPDGRTVVPYAHLDFTLSDTPKDLLSILVTLRNQLQWHLDGQDKHLHFPRFDLGASIALATRTGDNLPLLNQEEIESKLSSGLPFFGPLGEMGNALGNMIPIIPPLLVGLKWMSHISTVQTLLLRLEKGPGWQWYQTHTTDVGLRASANIKDVLLRLHALSMPGQPGTQGREHLVGQVLPAAFLADICDALDGPDAPHAWSKATSVVLFLDGFDALLSEAGPGNVGIRFLEMLALSEHRKRGETDPLLLVVGSRQRLLERTDADQHPPFEALTAIDDEQAAQEHARMVFGRWYHELPPNRRFLRLRDLYLPVWLPDFGRDDTHTYLVELGEQEHTQVLTDHALVEAIYHVTKGHLLFVALAASAALEAEAHGQRLNLQKIAEEVVSPEIAPGHEDEAIAEYLLSLFLRQLPLSEQKELIFCAAARALDAAIMQAVLHLPAEVDAQDCWRRYRRLTFMRAIDDKRIVLHPILRTLLLRRLPASQEAESDIHVLQTATNRR